MGGIGKTTLARKIFNHETICNKFATRIWLCISQNFNEEHLLQQIIRSAGGKYGVATTRSELEPILASILLVKSFFVILDDVWSADVWENLLKIPLESGAARGRILVTTRYEFIARSMRANVIHRVDKMKDSDGWVFLYRMVFGDAGEDEVLGFRDLGAQIVKKCDGLPLAIKVIAGVLREKEIRIVEWEELLRSDIWSMTHLPEELREALYLSYENLSPDLKQCFLFCSLYPEDSRLYRDDMVRDWVDVGLIRAREGDVLMEQVAEDYYKELITRNLLQTSGGSYCSMHDLVHSLAMFLRGGESICHANDAHRLLSPSAPNASSLTKLRHMFISNVGDGSRVLNQIKSKEEQSCLRTLIIHDSTLPRMLKDNVFKRLVRLRVLKLNSPFIERLSNSVGKLIHLRQLNLAYTGIRMLPETIRNLVNLQTLNLQGCRCLQGLPNGIMQLRNLRCLRINGSGVRHMPRGIGQLKNLNELTGFIAGSEGTSSSDQVAAEGCTVTELQSLSRLRILTITHMERAATKCNSPLENNFFLSKLELSFSRELSQADMAQADSTQEQILEGLSLPPNLQELSLSGYAGRRFPGWILSPSPSQMNYFHRLEILVIENCRVCLQLPPLAQLPELRTLRIIHVDSVASIGCEFIGHNHTSAAFPKLERLSFSHMSNWEQWSLVVGEERLLPRLKYLRIGFCHKLRSLPESLQLATSLQEIVIVGAGSLQEIKNLPLTERLFVWNGSGLERLSDFPKLETIKIAACPELKQVVNLDSLRHIDLNCSVDPVDQIAVRLPEWIGGLVQQRLEKYAHSSAPLIALTLRMTCSPSLLRRCIEGGPDWPIISQIDRVHITAKDEGGSSLLWYTRMPPSYNYTDGR